MNGQPSSPGMCRNALAFGGVVMAGETTLCIVIGNSFFYYNNGLPGHVSHMEKAADPANKQAYRNTMVTIGGSGFDWHDVESYFRPNAIGSYSFDDDNNVVFNKLDKLFDVAVMD